jgi:hypothetical protein
MHEVLNEHCLANADVAEQHNRTTSERRGENIPLKAAATFSRSRVFSGDLKFALHHRRVSGPENFTAQQGVLRKRSTLAVAFTQELLLRGFISVNKILDEEFCEDLKVGLQSVSDPIPWVAWEALG